VFAVVAEHEPFWFCRREKGYKITDLTETETELTDLTIMLYVHERDIPLHLFILL